MLTISHAHSPVFSSYEHKTVNLMVKFVEFEEELPFNATPYDTCSYGVDLFNRAIAGEFGEITSFEEAFPEVAAAYQNQQMIMSTQPKVEGAQTL